jgi:gelsolin
LDTNDTFILEVEKQVMIWIGKKANDEEKKNALVIGKGFMVKNNKPKGTRVTRIVEDAEDAYFKSFFNGFYPILKKDHGGGNTDKSV